jgi:hypothetical protein
MSVPARAHARRGGQRPLIRPYHGPPTIDALTAKARHMAYLFRYGWLDLPEAVDKFQHWAECSGAVQKLGQDIVQDVASEAFAHIPREEF